MRSKYLIAYAMDFASFLIQKVQDKNMIKNIILFGSVARDESDKRSDVDIFIEVAIPVAPFVENSITQCLIKFRESPKYKDYWKLLGVENEIKLKIGKLDEWEELKPSIIANGILLYGKFMPEVKGGKHKTFFIWENLKPNSTRVLFNKQLYGYRQGKKFYSGIIQKYSGERLGKGCIAVPLEYANIFHGLFKKYRIGVKIKKVLAYGE